MMMNDDDDDDERDGVQSSNSRNSADHTDCRYHKLTQLKVKG